MAKYEIKISTSADTTGAKATAEYLKKVEDASRKVEDAHKKHAGAADHLGGSFNKLRQAFNHVSRELPVLGTILHQLHNPFTLLAAAIGVAVAQFTKFKEQVDTAAEAALGFGTLSMSIKNFDSIMRAAKDRQRSFVDELDRISGAAEAADERLSRLNARSKAMFGAEREAIKKRVAAGGLTEAEGLKGEAAIDKREKIAAVEHIAEAALFQRQAVREGQEALPAAITKREAAEKAVARAEKQDEAQKKWMAKEFPGGRESIVSGIAAMEERIKDEEDSHKGALGPLLETIDPLWKSRMEARREKLALAKRGLAGLDYANAQPGKLLDITKSNLTRAQEEEDRIRKTVTLGTTTLHGLGAQQSAAQAEIIPVPSVPQTAMNNLQIRFDNQLEALMKRLIQSVLKQEYSIRALENILKK